MSETGPRGASGAGRGTALVRRLASLRRALRLGSDFAPYLRPHRARLATAIFLSIFYAAFRLFEPWPIQILFDQAVLGHHTRFLGIDPLAAVGGSKTVLLGVAALAVLLLAAGAGAVYYAQNILLARIGQEIVQDLRKDVFHQMQRLSLGFHRRTGTGDLTMRLTGDMVLLREMILASLVTLFSQVLILFAVIALMASVSLRLTAIAFVLAPGLYLLFRLFRARMLAAARTQRHREGRLAASLDEVLLAIPMIQAYTAEEREDERFRWITKKSARAGFAAARLEAAMQRSVEMGVAIATCLVLWFGVREVLEGHLTPGTFLVFLAYLRMLVKPVRGISKVTERTARASAAAERVLEILRAKRDVRDSKDAVSAPAFHGEIRFDHVGFAYENGTVALEDVTFRIAPGEQVALVGPTGAGKSTLFSLILRLQDPTTGRVRIDGRKIREFTVKSLRRQIAYLSQEPFLVAGTIRENLLYGDPEASEERIWSVLRAASLDQFVRALPAGLDTPIQFRGQSLSGGQKQRLAIARALLKDAPILLLDEPSTGLDARSEDEVLAGLEALRAGRTTITIAHRFASVRSADRVLVLDRGRLVEDGAPQELLARDSLFHLLASLQGFSPDAQTETERPPRSSWEPPIPFPPRARGAGE